MPKFVLGRVVGPKGAQGEQGIQGLQGIQGEQGIPGADGVTPNLKVGTVTVAAAGSPAAVTRREGSPDAEPVFDFVLPKGDKGDTGSFSGSCFFRVFEPWQWTGNTLRIPRSEHGMDPARQSCIHTLRARLGRNAVDYRLDSEAAQARQSILSAVQAALAANTATPGSYPTAEDGHVLLSWEQVQYYLLDGELAGAEDAEYESEQKGFDWKETDTTGAEETVSLDQVLSAAYIPALGAPQTAYDALVDTAALRGLRLRRRADGVAVQETYDLTGRMSTRAWCALECSVTWDTDTLELVLESPSGGFSGDVTAMG